MKLVKLSCNHDSFQTIEFNSNGLTIILGSKSDDKNNSSVNGVGKTQAMRLVNFCLGTKSTSLTAKTLKHAVPHWIFSLEFTIGKTTHVIDRSGDSNIIQLNGEKLKLAQLHDWLNISGVFPKVNNYTYLSFRSLFRRFLRVEREDSLSPLTLEKETAYTSLINNAYLMGLDLTLIKQKHQLKEKVEANKATQKLLKQDSYLQEVFKTSSNPLAKKKELEKEIPKLENNLKNFTIADDYHKIEKQAEELTNSCRDIQMQMAALNFKIESINKSLIQNPDINNQQLLELYQGLQQIFKPEALTHFETVQKFHDELTINRITRLEKEKLQIQNQINNLDSEFTKISTQRDQKLFLLKEKRALDEYLILANQLASYQEELEHLNKYITFDDDIKKQNLEIKKQILTVISSALEYVKSDPLQDFNAKYQAITNVLYPHLSSGIFIETVDSENNMLTYEISVELETDGSDGVSDAKVLAYDWLIFNYGNHNMQTLWHDNRIFADIDPEELAKWFTFVFERLDKSDKQYVVSININNYQDMKSFLAKDLALKLDQRIKIKLLGDKPSNKLMGINFDKPRKNS